MTTKTICQILRDLDKLKGDKHYIAMARLEKWIMRMHPPRRHQNFSWLKGRYVDDGE